MNQVEYNTNKANAIKASREGLLRESKAAREELLKATQDEQKRRELVTLAWIKSEMGE